MGEVVSFGSVIDVELSESRRTQLAEEARRRGVSEERLARDLVKQQLAAGDSDDRTTSA